LELHPNSRLQKDDVRQVPYQGPTFWEWPLNPAIIWCFWLGFSELIMFLYIRSEKTAVAMLETSGASLHKLIAWASRKLGFLHL
jgi:hypothetical protein